MRRTMMALGALGALAIAAGACRQARDAGPAAPAPAATAGEPALVARVKALAAESASPAPGTMSELVRLYGEAAVLGAAPAYVEARRLAARALLRQREPAIAIEAVLAAVRGDPTPRDRDPLWQELVQGVGALWDSRTLEHGRDLALTEENKKARELVLESLAETRPEKLSAQERATLASDFIDLYAQIAPERRARVDRALHDLAGNDVVEILAGRGVYEGSSTHLEVAAERERALKAAGVTATAPR